MSYYSSGGPLMDIIETSEGCRTGYLATDAMDYANSLRTILYNSNEENEKIKDAARYAYMHIHNIRFYYDLFSMN